ncbi:MAG TPA: anthranilate synthase component I family protein [Malonomonas sp.]
MPIKTFSVPLQKFDPLLCHLQFAAGGPGFLETLNPMTKTGRYSVVPLRTVDSYCLQNRCLTRSAGERLTELPGEPMQLLAEIHRQRSIQGAAETPFPGGFFGYFGYDICRLVEELPQQAERDLPIADLRLDWVDITAVFDHHQQRLLLGSLDDSVDLKVLAQRIIDGQQQSLVEAPLRLLQPLQPKLQPETFMAMVETARDYIAAGDIYQVNLSCRFDGRLQGNSSELYRRLRSINPAPFACLLQWGDFAIISSSPERLVSLHGSLAETRPIAGTRPRGSSELDDSRLGAELLAHPKERAEHIMLLDLERNDLGKVCVGGSVSVDELMVLERYSHVTHIVSNVRGTLRPEFGPFDLLRATFPGGTITGVPKKRCMEIIDELEPVGRGSYTGSAGYISACGSMDLNILIRSFQRIGEQLSYQAGAGIVADSIPEKEWLECLAKGEAMRLVLKAVEE